MITRFAKEEDLNHLSLLYNSEKTEFLKRNDLYVYEESEELGYAKPSQQEGEMALSERVEGKIVAGDVLKVVETLDGNTVVHSSVIVPNETLSYTTGFEFFAGMQILNFSDIYFQGCQSGVQIEVYKMKKVFIDENLQNVNNRMDIIEKELIVEEKSTILQDYSITQENIELNSIQVSEVINFGDIIEYNLFYPEGSEVCSGQFICPKVAQPQTDSNNVTMVLSPNENFIFIYGIRVSAGMRLTLVKISEISTKEKLEKIEDMPPSDYNQNDETKKDYIKNRPFYEKLETLTSQKIIRSGEENFSSTDFLWKNSSLRLKDKDIIVFHITDTNSGKEDYIEAPLYYTEDSYWGNKGFDTNLDDAWFGYNGIVDNNNLYTGVRLVVPPMFDGTAEIGRTVLKQLDEKFIPDSIKYTYITDKKIGEGYLGENDIIPGVKSFTIDTYTKGPAEEDAVVGNNSPYCITISEKISAEYAHEVVGKQVQIVDVSAQNKSSSIITVEIVGVGVDYSTLYSSKLPSPLPFTPNKGDKIYLRRFSIECSEDIKAGDILKIKGYFVDDTIEEYIVTVPYGFDGNTESLVDNAGRLGQINMPTPTTVSFICEVKGEVYKMSKVLISDTVTEIDIALNNIIEKYGLGV